MSAVQIGQMIAAEIQDAYAKGLRDGYANALSQIREVEADNKRLRAENEASRTQIDADTDEIAAWQAENDTLRARVERLTYESDDGSEWEHNGHPPNGGEAECPGCWAADIRRALRGDR